MDALYKSTLTLLFTLPRHLEKINNSNSNITMCNFVINCKYAILVLIDISLSVMSGVVAVAQYKTRCMTYNVWNKSALRENYQTCLLGYVTQMCKMEYVMVKMKCNK